MYIAVKELKLELGGGCLQRCVPSLSTRWIATFMRLMTAECWVGVREFSMLSGNKKGNTLVAKTSLEMPNFLWLIATLKIPVKNTND